MVELSLCPLISTTEVVQMSKILPLANDNSGQMAVY